MVDLAGLKRDLAAIGRLTPAQLDWWRREMAKLNEALRKADAKARLMQSREET